MTTENPAPPGKTSASNVVPLREPAPTIEAESGWNVQWNGCSLRFSDGPYGRLVRLFDVVRWQMRTPRELPLAEAIRAVVSAFDGAESPAVYLVDPATFAKPLARDWRDTDKYFQNDGALRGSNPIKVAVSHLEAVLIQPHELSKLVNAVGVDPEYDPRAETPFDFMERTSSPGANLAVDFAAANRLWGWGRVVSPAVDAVDKPSGATTKRPTTWSELVTWPDRKAKGFEWPDDLRLIVVRESQRRHGLGNAGVTASMAAEFGCTDRNVRKVIAGEGSKGSRERVLASAVAALCNGTDGTK